VEKKRGRQVFQEVPMIRSALAIWKGSPGAGAGEGSVSTTSGVIHNALYSFGSGTGNEPCTSPSEMLAAAVASCMSLMVAGEMAKAGLKDECVKTESQLTLEEDKGRWDITEIRLNVVASVPEIHAKKFQQVAETAKAKCPIARALKIPIKMTVKEELEKNVVAA
jgi:osmotically inducible protein OsmC